jgi:hypothetical protein
MKLPWQFDPEKFRQEHRWDRLGTYNAERDRGLVHTRAYELRMAEEQRLFDQEMRAERERQGIKVIEL